MQMHFGKLEQDRVKRRCFRNARRTKDVSIITMGDIKSRRLARAHFCGSALCWALSKSFFLNSLTSFQCSFGYIRFARTLLALLCCPLIIFRFIFSPVVFRMFMPLWSMPVFKGAQLNLKLRKRSLHYFTCHELYKNCYLRKKYRFIPKKIDMFCIV